MGPSEFLGIVVGPPKSHQPSGLGWFRVVYLFSTPLLFNPSGFNPLGRGLPLPLPLHWIIPPLSRDEREEKVVVVCVCVLGCVMDSRKN